MHRYLNLILDLLFPRVRPSVRVGALTLNDLLPLIAPRAIRISGIEVEALFPYALPLIRDLMWALKYENSMHAARLCGDALADHLLESVSDHVAYGSSPLLIIPIPLSKERERERGYNQTERIAAEMATTLHSRGTVALLLLRIRNTPVQTKLSRAQRLINMKDAFALSDPKAVAGRHCLLIDDVVTTGSTLAEATKVLRAANAASVQCLTVAYATSDRHL
jgi:competence protein ComFC